MKQQFTRTRFPRPANQSWYLDNLAGTLLRNELFGAPVVVGAGLLNVWFGSAMEPKPVKVRIGAAWIIKPVKSWNGVSWAT